MAGNQKSAQAVNATMLLLISELAAFALPLPASPEMPSNMPGMTTPTTPINTEPIVAVDCVALAKLIHDLQQLDIEHCPGV